MKLYIVVEKALSAGLKCAQGIHAAFAFDQDYPALRQEWFTQHNNIVVLQAEDIPSLADRLEEAGFKLSRFTEPDLDDQLTAVAVEPAAWKQLSSLALVR